MITSPCSTVGCECRNAKHGEVRPMHGVGRTPVRMKSCSMFCGQQNRVNETQAIRCNLQSHHELSGTYLLMLKHALHIRHTFRCGNGYISKGASNVCKAVPQGHLYEWHAHIIMEIALCGRFLRFLAKRTVVPVVLMANY